MIETIFKLVFSVLIFVGGISLTALVVIMIVKCAKEIWNY